MDTNRTKDEMDRNTDQKNRIRDRERSRDKNRETEHCSDRTRLRENRRERQHKTTPRQFNIDMNKELMRISDTRELCDFVSTHAAEFNHVNVSTAFRQVLKTPRGTPPRALAQALQTLEESALQNMQNLGAR